MRLKSLNRIRIYYYYYYYYYWICKATARAEMIGAKPAPLIYLNGLILSGVMFSLLTYFMN